MTTLKQAAVLLQEEADAAKNAADEAQRLRIREFRKFSDKLTREELLELSYCCGEESGEDHCVYCAAWEEYIRRGED